MIFADKLIQLRKKAGWSQEELADRMNVSRQSVSKWEGAVSVPDLERILQLSQLFGVSTDYLLKDELEDTEYVSEMDAEDKTRRVTMEEASAFLLAKEATSRPIAFGVYLCVLSPIPLLLLSVGAETGAIAISEDAAGGLGIILLLLIVAIAVAIFLYCESKTKEYQYLETEVIDTEYGVTGMVKERQRQYKDTYTRYNIIGTCLCILSAVPIFAGSFLTENDFVMVYCVCFTLALAGAGAVFFIIAGIRNASTEKLLQEGEYTLRAKKRSPLTNAIHTIYWLLVVAAYLAYSFSTNNWKSSWIIWPVAAVVSAAIGVLCNTIDNMRK